MIAINTLSKAIDCPSKFLFELQRIPSKERTNAKSRNNKNDSTEEQTMGIIFESSIQHIMLSGNHTQEHRYEQVISWLRDAEKKKRKICINELSPPWDETWIKRDSVLNTGLVRSQWYKIRKAVKRWKNGDLPWVERTVDWSREKEIDAEIELEAAENKYQFLAIGRVDLYGKGEDTDYVVELKMTKPNTLHKARAQASLYVKVLESINPSSSVDGYVFHSTELIQHPYSEEEWGNLILRGLSGEVQPTSFNCDGCMNEGCTERFVDGR